MLFLQLLQYSLYVSYPLVVGSMTFLLFVIFKSYIYTRGLSKRLYHLGKDTGLDVVNEFVNYIDIEKDIPWKFYTSDLIRSAYKLVNMDENADSETKEKLKRVILSKGILVD